LYVLAGLVFGGGIALLISRMRSNVRGMMLVRELELLKEDKAGLEKDIRQKDESLLEVNRDLAARTAELKHLSERYQAEKEELGQIQQKFQDAFRNLANEILEEKAKTFTQQNKDKLDEIIKPLRENIRTFEKKVDETYVKGSRERFALDKEVKRLAELNKQISEDATRLTEALKGESKTQGNWGEMILESILEKSGLVKDREYFAQESLKTADGRRLQPDVIVRIPDNRNVIIDAKVSLTAYERYVSANGEEDRETARRDHINSVKNHVQELSNKNFVMMFMPVEPAYILAVQIDRDIWNYAYERRILLVSPTNLLVSLKMIASLWRQEYQTRNVLEIARQSGDLLDKFYALLNDLTDLGSRLKSAQKSYDDTLNKLSEGKGNLIRRAEKIRNLGARTKKSLPDQFSGSLGEEIED
jgi:DNA recombination protein RmuC